MNSRSYSGAPWRDRAGAVSNMQEDVRTGHSGEAHWDLPENADQEKDHF